ncbi:MAG TPA: PqqD family protein [Candidatus Polarisedimenticolia bacterium]|nr:PqqD family protein [Candidatus Polarisedimenticolia bacterium]
MTDWSTNPPKRHPTAGFRVFEGGETTIVLPDGSYIHVLNPIGTRVWELLDGVKNESEIVDILCEEFDGEREQVTKDVREFLTSLEANRMLD